jgi:hypothetical protein
MARTNFLLHIKSLAAVLLFAALFQTSANAATLTVYSAADAGGTCPGNDCTLRQALATVASGDTINFAAGITTITLTSGELVINKAVTIAGPGANLLTVRRDPAAANFRIFETFFVSLFTNITISGMTIANGSDTVGGAIYSSHETLQITNCIISDNTATSGGGLYSDPNAHVTITNCTLANNKATDGGAIDQPTAVSMTIINSTISGNSANGGSGSAHGGGGIFNGNGSDLTLTNTTITGNSTSATAGGVWTDGTATFNNCTIVGNSSAQDAGGLRNFRTATLSNTIVATNTATVIRDIEGTCTSGGYNFVGDAGSSGLTNGSNGDQVGSTGAPINPKLDTLKDNGGPTFTCALLPGSPAIDKGKSSASTTDQRGLPRPVVAQSTALPSGGDGSDIGAYEVQPDQLPACKGVNSVVTNNNDSGLESLRDVVGSVCVGSTITFAANVRGVISLTTGQLIIDRNLTIIGPGANLLTVQRDLAAPSSRIFNIGSNHNVTISGLTISNGTAPGDRGGGILNSGTLTLVNDTVSLNSAIGGNGGGIYTSGPLTVVGSAISGNKIDSPTPGSGGGIFNFGTTVTITNSTISGNSAVSPGGTTDHGGGIFSNVGTVTLNSCTITANSSDNGGGLLGANGAVIKPKSTIFALNITPASTSGPDVNGPIKSQGYNIFGTTSGATITAPAAPATDQTGTATLNLGPLQDNGGPTFTHALGAGSSAIDQGSAAGLTSDQRGFARNVDISGTPNANGGDGSDVGAFEFVGIVPSVTTGAATNLTQTSATLSATVNPNGTSTTAHFVSDAGSFSAQYIGDGTSPTSVMVNVTGLTPGTQYHFNATATNAAGTSQGVQQTFTTIAAPTPIPTATPTATPGLVGNVSTRLFVGADDNALFEGFIVQGPAGSTKKIIVRAIGPSLLPFGINDALADPTLEIHDSNQVTVATNNDWRNTQVGGIITGDQSAEISGSGFAPANDLESAIIANLTPGSYTAVVRGAGNATGTGVVDAYDLSGSAPARVANIATRGLIRPGDNLMIAGFIVQNGSVSVVVTALGPSLQAFGVNNALPDTTLQLKDQNGTIVRENDDWMSDQKTELESTGLQPGNNLEAALVQTIPPGQYSALVRGKPETTGIGVVQLFFLQN